MSDDDDDITINDDIITNITTYDIIITTTTDDYHIVIIINEDDNKALRMRIKLNYLSSVYPDSYMNLQNKYGWWQNGANGQKKKQIGKIIFLKKNKIKNKLFFYTTNKNSYINLNIRLS